MQDYHESNPYATVPQIGRLLDLIIERCPLGGTIAPGNRAIAKWLGFASVGGIPALIAQLACDGWIEYDPRSGTIQLLRTPYAGAAGADDPALDHPDAVHDYLMSLRRQRPRDRSES